MLRSKDRLDSELKLYMVTMLKILNDGDIKRFH